MTETQRFSRMDISPDFVTPVDDAGAYITSPWGQCRESSTRVDPRCPAGHRLHNGADIIATNRRAPIRAIYDGVVTDATVFNVADPDYNYTPGYSDYGRIVAIQHFPGLSTLSAHLSVVAVRKGESVRRGQIIGYMGRTRGDANEPRKLFNESGAHTHFEMMRGTYPVSPLVDRVDPVVGLREGAGFFSSSVPRSDSRMTPQELRQATYQVNAGYEELDAQINDCLAPPAAGNDFPDESWQNVLYRWRAERASIADGTYQGGFLQYNNPEDRLRGAAEDLIHWRGIARLTCSASMSSMLVTDPSLPTFDNDPRNAPSPAPRRNPPVAPAPLIPSPRPAVTGNGAVTAGYFVIGGLIATGIGFALSKGKR